MVEWVWRRKKEKERRRIRRTKKKCWSGSKEERKKEEENVVGDMWVWLDNTQVMGPTISSYLCTCHWVSIFKFWKQLKLVFTFHHLHPFFWVIESWKQSLKTPPNRCSFVGPIQFGWWIMKTDWYHSVFIPSKQALKLPSYLTLSLILHQHLRAFTLEMVYIIYWFNLA